MTQCYIEVYSFVKTEEIDRKIVDFFSNFGENVKFGLDFVVVKLREFYDWMTEMIFVGVNDIQQNGPVYYERLLSDISKYFSKFQLTLGQSLRSTKLFIRDVYIQYQPIVYSYTKNVSANLKNFSSTAIISLTDFSKNLSAYFKVFTEFCLKFYYENLVPGFEKVLFSCQKLLNEYTPLLSESLHRVGQVLAKYWELLIEQFMILFGNVNDVVMGMMNQ